VKQSLDIDADLRLSLNDVEVGIIAHADEIRIHSDFWTLVHLSRLLHPGSVTIRSLDQVLRHIGLTLVYRKRFCGISLLGFKAKKWVVSFLSYWLS
jgi:hypothetical protein